MACEIWQGFTVRYADEVPTARTQRRIEQAKQEIAEGKGLRLADLPHVVKHDERGS